MLEDKVILFGPAEEVLFTFSDLFPMPLFETLVTWFGLE